jgi:thiol:disulfide interchange protein DsbD
LDRDAFTVCYQSSELSMAGIKQAIAALGFNPRLAGMDDVVAPARPKPPADTPEPVAGALATARASNRLLFVEFYAEWCAPCRVLEESVFPAPEVQKALEAYVFVKVDTDAFPAAGEHFDVAAMPTLLVLDSRGKELHRSIGMIETKELAKLLEQLAESAGDGRKPAPQGSI